MKVRGTKEEKSTVCGYLLPLITMAVVVAVFAIITMSLVGRTRDREEETLKKTVTRASIQCCATEERYPPSMEYLEENYEVQIDRKKYNVLYGDFASGVMSEIDIMPIEE